MHNVHAPERRTPHAQDRQWDTDKSNGVVGKVNISKSTYDHVKNDVRFSFEKREKIDVKGKGEIVMWYVSLVGIS